MSTQEAVVQYALDPLSVELREIPIPEIGEHDVLRSEEHTSELQSRLHLVCRA